MRSMCALAQVVMAKGDCKWKERMADNNMRIEDDGRHVNDARDFMCPKRAG